MIYTKHIHKFFGEKNSGAYFNNQRIRVSKKNALDECLFGSNLESLKNIELNLRVSGSAALDLAYVAAGRFDGFWEQNLSSWDMAAGIIIVKEAGGILESIETNHTPLETGNIICSNNQETVFKKFSEIIRSSIH